LNESIFASMLPTGFQRNRSVVSDHVREFLTPRLNFLILEHQWHCTNLW